VDAKAPPAAQGFFELHRERPSGRDADGKPLVQGKKVTGLTNTEEGAVGLTKVAPFLVEDQLKAKGGLFSKTEDWGVHVVTDGLLITGQNPASSGPAAKVLLKTLSK
jgi:putative intracellular protease/amidase